MLSHKKYECLNFRHLLFYHSFAKRKRAPSNFPLFHGVTKFGGIRKLRTFNDLASHVFSNGRFTAITTATSSWIYATTPIFIERTLRSFVTTTIPPAITDVISITFSVPFAARAKLEITAIVPDVAGKERMDGIPAVKWVRFFVRSLGRGTPGFSNSIVSLVP